MKDATSYNGLGCSVLADKVDKMTRLLFLTIRPYVFYCVSHEITAIPLCICKCQHVFCNLSVSTWESIVLTHINLFEKKKRHTNIHNLK